jgi:signal transduction histidine kinase
MPVLVIRRSLTYKLTVAFLSVSLLGVALPIVIMLAITSAEFNRFLINRGGSDFLAACTAYYQRSSSWDGVGQALTDQGLMPPQSSRPGERPPPQPFVLTGVDGRVIIAGDRFHMGEVVPAPFLAGGTAITFNGQVVGTFLVSGSNPFMNPMDEQYLARTNQSLLISGVGTVALALLLGILLARSITRPVRELTAAAKSLAGGRLGKQVPVRSQDELGDLARTFNQMSTDLENANQLRRHMTADIAHDLRTPLTVMTGYLESLRDGVLKPTPQRFEVLYNEAKHLQRLVEDLRTLSLADSGELAINRQAVAPGDLMERLQQAFAHRAEQMGIGLECRVEPDLPDVQADPERMEQVLGNLVSNALRSRKPGGIELSVTDDGAGIEPEVLPHIFERFYRGDESRSQQDEESGLGLAIARSIVELHGGKIDASSAGPGQGAVFTIFMTATRGTG